MKKQFLFLAASLAAIAASAQTTRALQITDLSGNRLCVPYAHIDSVYFKADTLVVATPYGSLPVATADIAALAPLQIEESERVDIAWDNSAGATYTNCMAHRGVTVSVDNGHVTVDNRNTSDEVTLSVSGEHCDGSLTYYGAYKATLCLHGLTLCNPGGAAIDIECGKRIGVLLAEGSENSLTDGADGTQKAALYFKGHAEFEGAGTLNVRGNAKHAIASKEYMQLKKSTGTLNILAAANDGIHAGQYFKMNGGKVTIKNVAGDGIQAEATADEGDEEDGRMSIKGGTIEIVADGDDVACLKADSLISISGGSLSLTAGGVHSRGIKAKSDLCIEGGAIDIVCTGDGTLTDPDADKETNTTGPSYKVYVSVASSGGGTGFPGGGGGGGSSLWGNVYLYNEGGTKVATLSGTVSIRGTNGSTKSFYCYDFGKAVDGKFYFASDNYTSAWGGSTSYAIKSSTFAAPTSGENVYYTMSSSYSTSGSTRTYSLTNATSTYAGGTMQADGNEAYCSACLKVDGSATIAAGSLSLTASGSGGKCVNADGNLTLGAEGADNGLLALTAATSGKCVSNTSSNTGGPGGGMGGSMTGQPKAIKAIGNIVVNSGCITATTKNDGGEGIESKAALTINGGVVVCNTYDDGMNAATKITVNDGIVWSWATNNDGIDCNGSQGIELNGGMVVANGTSAPEEGFDCDNYTFKINGGTIMGIGGATSSVTGASQPYASTGSVTVTSGKYLTMKSSDGSVIFSYLCPASLSGATVVTSSPLYQHGSSCSLVYGVTSVTDPTASYLEGRFLVGGTLNGGSSKSITPKTK